jgi:type IV secretion system protein VirD4
MADDYLNSAFEDMPWKEIGQGLLPLAAVTYLTPSIVALAHDGTLGLPVFPTIIGTFRIAAKDHLSDPAAAYPARIARHMPGPTWWWLTLLLGALVICMLAAYAWGRLEPAMAQARLGRKDNDPRGSRPRTWARARDVRDLSRPRHKAGRFSIGQLDHRPVYTGPEDHIVLVAPTRAGKTTQCVIPWLLEHQGPAIVTSTKTDVLEKTEAWRRTLGRVHIWDPLGPRSATWTPVQYCEDWGVALRHATWMGDANRQGDSEIASFWRGEAARLLAPLLHAAALADRTIGDVVRWVETQSDSEPLNILEHHKSDQAHDQLTGILKLDVRNRGTTYMSAGSLLEAYRQPTIRAATTDIFDVRKFLDGGANTLYIVASARDQQLLAPLAGGLLSTLINGAMEHPPGPGVTLRILLDEAANIAPLRDLPAYLSQAAGHNIRIATIWQSLAQLDATYAKHADTILANSTAKLFMGPIADDTTRRYITNLIGEERAPRTTTTTYNNGRASGQTTDTERRPALTARDLQQLRRGRAILVNGTHLPALVRLKPWGQRPDLRRQRHYYVPDIR